MNHSQNVSIEEQVKKLNYSSEHLSGPSAPSSVHSSVDKHCRKDLWLDLWLEQKVNTKGSFLTPAQHQQGDLEDYQIY
jgi:hypothetical protein